jgi:hypothetical protein
MSRSFGKSYLVLRAPLEAEQGNTAVVGKEKQTNGPIAAFAFATFSEFPFLCWLHSLFSGCFF